MTAILFPLRENGATRRTSARTIPGPIPHQRLEHRQRRQRRRVGAQHPRPQADRAYKGEFAQIVKLRIRRSRLPGRSGLRKARGLARSILGPSGLRPRAAAVPLSSHSMSLRPDGQDLSSSASLTGSNTVGTVKRSLCSAASMALALQPPGIDARHRGARGHHRTELADAQLGRLLDQEIEPRALDRREHQPQIAFVALLLALGQDVERAPAAALPGYPRAVFAVAAVEQGDLVALVQAQHRFQIMRLRRRTGRASRLRPGGLDIKAGDRHISHKRDIATLPPRQKQGQDGPA